MTILQGGPDTPPHQLTHTFKFKDYSPKAFAYIRRLFGINEYEFLSSVCGNASFIEFISNAKSGQFFFYSSDGKYMIKTMTTTESKFLRRILPHYFRHCVQCPDTLITKFFGMYRVKLFHLRRNVKFIIMNSVFDTDKYISSFFDVKGSKLGRDAKPGEMVKKDNDIRKTLPEEAFVIYDEVRSRMRAQIIADCKFLEQMKIMDYSMLIGVHRMPASKSTDHRRTLSRANADDKSIRNLISDRASGMKRGSMGKSIHTYDVTTEASHYFHPDKVNGVRQASNRSIPPITGADSAASDEVQQDEKPLTASGKTVSVILSALEDETKADFTPSGVAAKKPSTRLLRRSSSDGEAPNNTIAFRGMSDDVYYEMDEDESSFLEGSNHNFGRSGVTFADELANYHDSMDPVGVSFSLNKTEYSFRNIDLENALIPVGHGPIECGESLDPVEIRKELATEQMYWPFHRFYDIQGWRRMEPFLSQEAKATLKSISSSAAPDQTITDEFGVPRFLRPISDRKDKGLMMNVDRLRVVLEANSKEMSGEPNLQPKIFYMGIIDVLQQFNLRKRIEARMRRIQGGGWADASCVHPQIYASRFLEFFDEYTLANYSRNGHVRIDEDDEEHDSSSDISHEQIVFSKNTGLEDEPLKKSKSKMNDKKDASGSIDEDFTTKKSNKAKKKEVVSNEGDIAKKNQ